MDQSPLPIRLNQEHRRACPYCSILIIPSPPSSADRYSRDELSALIRIQYEDRVKIKHIRGGKGKKLLVPKVSVQVLAPPDSSWRALKREMMEAVDARCADDPEVDETVPDAQEQMNPPLRHDEVNMVEGTCSLYNFHVRLIVP